MAQFDPTKYILTYVGQQVNLGTAPGTHILVEPSADLITPYIGSGGDYIMAVNRDWSTMVTLTLLGTALMNAFLSTRVQLIRSGAYGGGPLELMDLTGTTLAFSPEAWVMGPPPISVGQEGGDINREWRFACGKMDPMFVGGSL